LHELPSCWRYHRCLPGLSIYSSREYTCVRGAASHFTALDTPLAIAGASTVEWTMADSAGCVMRRLQGSEKRTRIRIRSSPTHCESEGPMPVYDRITTTIEREWLAQIIAGTKKIEYGQIKPYWTKRFDGVSVPFELRLLNGMNRPVPEVTVLIHKVTKDRRAGEYQLHIKKVVGFTGTSGGRNRNGESRKIAPTREIRRWSLPGPRIPIGTWRAARRALRHDVIIRRVCRCLH